jgi:two-component system sensor histidine kinase/response regulator
MAHAVVVLRAEGVPMTASEISSYSGHATQVQPLSAETAVLDVDASLRRLGGDRNILIELAKMFAEDSPGLMGAIEQGIQQARYSDAGRAAHSLRGLAANFGAARLMHRLRELEAALAQGNREGSLTLMVPTSEEKLRLQEALNAYCQ